MTSSSNNGIKYSEYFGALLGAQSKAERATIFFERLAKFFAELGRDIRSGDDWRALARRLGFEYHPEYRLKGPLDRESPDWEGIDGLRLLADGMGLAADGRSDAQVGQIMASDPPYAERYREMGDPGDRLGAARQHFGWLLEILDEAESKDFPAKAAFVATFSIADSGQTPEAD